MMDIMGTTHLTLRREYGIIRNMKRKNRTFVPEYARLARKVADCVIVAAVCAAMQSFAASERIADFGSADTSAANTFWNVSGYNGGSVWRQASSSVSGFSARSRTRMSSRGIPLRTSPAGAILIFR